ncbi:hypothetical protein ACFRAQ_34440 [Nocardia sp. NPDC056611]|uniref:hypothetical protein n=1 Tax=Nocardia sp. NPDC056611 TaxID=3345877 RepID=UPI00366DD019
MRIANRARTVVLEVLVAHSPVRKVVNGQDRVACCCGALQYIYDSRTFDAWHQRHVRYAVGRVLEVRDWTEPMPRHTPNLRHARDFTDVEFLSAVSAAQVLPDVTLLGDLVAELESRGFEASRGRSGRHQDQVPRKLVRAKAARLIQRGLLEGCPCGCDGLFQITEAGRALMAEAARA